MRYHFPIMGEFSDSVYAAVRRVPRGRVASYGQIARLIGAPRKARFVGYALHDSPDPWDAEAERGIPCHRIVFKDGRLASGYAFGGEDVQRRLLEREGVSFADDEHVDMASCQWDGHTAGAPDTEGLPPDAPTAPPPDFDWQRELGEGWA